MSDLISRQAAIKALQELNGLKLTRRFNDSPVQWIDRMFLEAEAILKNLPSAEPERKKGQWIEYPDCLGYEDAYSDDHIVCSVCGHVYSICNNCTEEFDFCPHCGADMRGE